jgi:transcriptional regulator with XRE-family HTH domain
VNGEVLKAMRIYFGLSQRDMAASIGITAAYLCMLESNYRPVTDTVRIKFAQKHEITDGLREALRRSKLADSLLTV